MSYDLESNAETLGDRPEIAVMNNSATDVEIGGTNVGKSTTYPTVSVIIPTFDDVVHAPYGKKISHSLMPPGYIASMPGAGWEVWFS